MKITEIPAKPQEKRIIRVAAYARVSSDKDAAFHSLEAQTAYYDEYVSAHADWELVGIYSDNGISGTIINRPEFQRMLEDCRSGKIDLVISKSITRFARNTVILLETIRELKSLGIDCYFEKENMHSISPDGELLLTLLAMYAEEEARSASENQLWRIRKKFENGEPWVGNMLGYRLVDGKLVIVPEEADIVRQIFHDYASGMGKAKIAKKLNAAGVPARTGAVWKTGAITSVLYNEKYAGNMLLQKTYRADFRTKKDLENHGTVRQYYVSHSHPAIVDQNTYNIVRAKLEENQKRYQKRTVHHLFRGLIYCDSCGRCYTFRYAGKGKYRRAIWICPTLNDLGKTACPSQQIPEEILCAKTMELLQVDTLTYDIIQERIASILVPEHNLLVYTLKDGSTVEIPWEHISRKHSWTPEMRQAARERAMNQHAERRKNAKRT